MKRNFLSFILMLPIFILFSCDNETENLEVSNENILKEENIAKITKFSIENIGKISYRIDLVNPINDIDYILITKDSKNNNTFSRFIKEDNGIKNLYTNDGIYDYSIKYNDSNQLITYKDENLSDQENLMFKSGNCYEGCMEDAEYNWMADSDGNPSDGIERAYNEATWVTIGENVAIGVCGGCCEGWWDCPERVQPENIIVSPGDLIEIVNPGEDLVLPN